MPGTVEARTKAVPCRREHGHRGTHPALPCGEASVPTTSWDPSGANAMPAMQRRSSGSASALTLTACRTSSVRVSMMLNVSECCVEPQRFVRARTGPY